MPLITGRARVLEVLGAAAARGWVLPAFNSENLTTTEAVLAATLERAHALGTSNVPIIVDITNTYRPRPQAVNFTHTHRWEVGLKLFLAELRVLCEPPSPYADLPVLVHLDHIQWDSDAVLLAGDLGGFSSIMFDASTLPMEENIARTAAFVATHGQTLLIEGACDEIAAAGHAAAGDNLTEPATAERFWRATGVDVVVANLGTEHRASASSLRYRGDLARAITARIGPRLCLHGASSVPRDELGSLFSDGVRRVNLWTALERDSTPVLLGAMQTHAERLAGPGARLEYFTTTWRQGIVFEEMKRIVRRYLDLWYA
jgi:fructose/tagatose bisphosphate aldolase